MRGTVKTFGLMMFISKLSGRGCIMLRSKRLQSKSKILFKLHRRDTCDVQTYSSINVAVTKVKPCSQKAQKCRCVISFGRRLYTVNSEAVSGTETQSRGL
jgi:hypothetical protein